MGVLAANTHRRTAKIYAIASDAVRTTGATMYAFARHELPEMSWSQFLASREGQLIAHMDAAATMATKKFVDRNIGDNHTFKSESARHELRQLWRVEQAMLQSPGNYAKLRQERSLGEWRMGEWSAVAYDELGYLALAFAEYAPGWQQIALTEYLPELEKLAAMGSWSAHKMLSISPEQKIEPLDDAVIADRFFFGDVQTMKALRSLYRGEVQPVLAAAGTQT